MADASIGAECCNDEPLPCRDMPPPLPHKILAEWATPLMTQRTLWAEPQLEACKVQPGGTFAEDGFNIRFAAFKH
eukprot:2326711-Amphidinium_carterae.1